eukprot:308456_1
MSSAPKKRSKNKKKNTKNSMQQRKRHSQSSKSSHKSKKRKQPNKFQTNLSWVIALILLVLILFAFIYSKRNKQTVISIPQSESESQSQQRETQESEYQKTTPEPIKNLKKIKKPLPSSLRLKYDHTYANYNKHLQLSKQDTVAPIPLLFKAKPKRIWNHDKNDFTQGFEVFNIDKNNKLILIESTGLYKQSKLKYIELEMNGINIQNRNRNRNTQLPNVYKTHSL